MSKSKQNLVFIHGFRGDASGLLPITKFIPTDQYNIYVPNLPPGDDQYLTEYTPATYVEFLDNYINKYHIQNPILIGHSMGSVIAAAYATHHPKKIHQKLVLLSPISHRPPFFIRLLQPLLVSLPTQQTSLLTILFLAARKTPNRIKELSRLAHHSTKIYHNHHHFKKSATFASTYDLTHFNFNKNTLVLNGEKEALIKNYKTEKLVADWQKTHKTALITLKNTGHLLNFERAKKVAETIISFLES